MILIVLVKRLKKDKTKMQIEIIKKKKKKKKKKKVYLRKVIVNAHCDFAEHFE